MHQDIGHIYGLEGEGGDMDQIIAYLGGALLIVTAIVSGCALLLKKIDVKRLAAFATIGFFSGTILLLSERITNIRLPILGEIVTKAREDAMEIKQVREEAEGQRKIVSGVVEQAKNLQAEMEQLTLSFQLKIRNTRKAYLQERINEIDKDIREREQNITNKIMSGYYNDSKTNQERFDAKRYIFQLRTLADKYSEELDSLEKELGALSNKPGTIKTVKLQNGQEVFNINGEWDVLIENYGEFKKFGTYPNVAQINIREPDGSFHAIRMKDSPQPGPRAGSFLMVGELDKNGITKLELVAGDGPRIPSKWKISENGNKINVDAPNRSRITFTRK